MFWIWRLLVAAAGRFEVWDERRYRIRMAQERSAEDRIALNAQVSTAVAVYLSAERLSMDGLDSLIGDLESCPVRAKNLALDFAAYAELWILFHEVIHAVPTNKAPGLTAEVLALDVVDEEQVESWLEEFRADIQAMHVLLEAQLLKAGGRVACPHAMYELFTLFGGIEFALRASAFCDEVEGVEQASHPSAERRFACLESLVKSKASLFMSGWDYWEWRLPFLVAWELQLEDYRESNNSSC